MFLLNIGYQWTLASLEDISGGIFLPMGNSSEKLARGSQPELSRFLIDPQLYLAGVQAERCTKICGRLATYPWFMVPDAPGFDSGAMSMRTWDAQLKEFAVKHWPGCAATEEEDIKFAANSAIEFQVQRGCTHIIFPGPLIDNREDYGETQANWLDKCIESADELDVGQPKLATVAIAEHVLNEAAFEEGGFLDTIIDQVTSRSGFDGVYILISQTVAAHPFEMSAPATRGYAYLVQGFAAHGYEFVLTNFADVFGWALLGLGATGFSTGGSQSIRRLCIDALADDGFGTPLPALYSQSVLGEFLSESDLDRIVSRKLTRYVRDITPYSDPLFEAFRAGSTAASVPSWAESRNNVSASQRHFVTRMALESKSGLSPRIRREGVRNGLETAAANSNYLLKRLSGVHLRGRLAPSEAWLDLLNELS